MWKHVSIACAIIVTAIVTWAIVAIPESLALDVYPPQPITHRVTVQPIVISDNDGSNTAELFGNALQSAAIESAIDTIWAQAGIDVKWLEPNYWNNTTANSGGYSLSDLDFYGADYMSSDPLVLNAYFSEIRSGSVDGGEYSASGLAWVEGNGISQAVGDELVTGPGGQEVVAGVVAHEIGHNLGLSHLPESLNLMQSGGDGERLNSSQISTALSSDFSILYSPVPGDFNDDGVIDYEDLLIWEGGFGTNSNATLAAGDADEDGDVDGNDFLIWQRSYAPQTPLVSLAAAIPEPTAITLGFLAALGLLSVRRR